MFAENASITGLSKVWSSLSCSNYPRYHSCGWKMKCFINLTHSRLLRPTTVLYLGQAKAFPVQLKIPKILFSFAYLPRQLWGSAFSQHFSVKSYQTRQQALLFYFLQMFVILSTVVKAVKWEETLENTEDLGEKHLLNSYTCDLECLCRNNAVWVSKKKIKLVICWMEVSVLNYQWVEIQLSWRDLQRVSLVYSVLRKQKTIQEDCKIFKQIWSSASKDGKDLKGFVYEERTQNPWVGEVWPKRTFMHLNI